MALSRILATMVSYVQAGTGAVRRYLQSKLREYASPLDYGATGDGVADDTAGIRAALAANRAVDMRGAKWRITGTIDVPAGRFIDMRGSDIKAECGTAPIFSFTGARESLYILHGGGTVSGAAGAFLYCAGTTDQPTQSADYARQIRLEGVYVGDPQIGKFVDMQKAVRQVFIDKCFAYTENGINANGKCVEVKVSKTIIFGATGKVGTYGVRTRSTGGGVSYNEGFHFDTCTVDAFSSTFDISDIYVLTVSNSYVGALAGGYAFDFSEPSTLHCRSINIGAGCVFYNPVRFRPCVAGRAFYAKVSGATFTGATGAHVEIGQNGAYITVENVKMDSSTGTGIGVSVANNCHYIVCDGIDMDPTFDAGVLFSGPNGVKCAARNISYAGTGSSVYAERPVLMSGIDLGDGTAAVNFQVGQQVSGTYAVGATMASHTLNFAQGETGVLYVELSCSGMDPGAAVQLFQVVIPAGMVVPSGQGWSAVYIYPAAAAGRISAQIPYYVTQDIPNGVVSLKNSAGNSVVVAPHSNFSIKR